MLWSSFFSIWLLLLCTAITTAKSGALVRTGGRKVRFRPLGEARYRSNMRRLPNSERFIASGRLIKALSRPAPAANRGYDGEEARTIDSNLNENLMNLVRFIQGNNIQKPGSTPLCVIRVSDVDVNRGDSAGQGRALNDSAVNCVVVVRSPNAINGAAAVLKDGEVDTENYEETDVGHNNWSWRRRRPNSRPPYRAAYRLYPYYPYYPYNYYGRQIRTRPVALAKDASNPFTARHNNNPPAIEQNTLKALSEYYAQLAAEEDKAPTFPPYEDSQFDPYALSSRMYNPLFNYRNI